MTDVTGDTFISYRRSQVEIVEDLVASLHEHGIPTWRDLTDLRTEPTQQELRRVLRDPSTSSGVVVVSQDTSESGIILELELPELHTRWSDNEDFYVVVALCPDVDYDRAGEILGQSPKARDFSPWNMIKLTLGDKRRVACDEVNRALVAERLRLIHEKRAADQSLECSLDTYGSRSYPEPLDLTIDWSHHFNNEFPSSEVWNERLLPALRTVLDQIEQKAPGRHLRFRGQAHIPATFALGRILRSPRGINAAWLQPTENNELEPWSLQTTEKETGLSDEFDLFDVTSSHLAVQVSITNDVEPVVGRTSETLPNFGGLVQLTLGDDIGTHLSAQQAKNVANIFREKVQLALNDLSATSKVHLFMAVPTGLSFLLGQQTNTFPAVQTYFLDASNGERTYQHGPVLN